MAAPHLHSFPSIETGTDVERSLEEKMEVGSVGRLLPTFPSVAGHILDVETP